MYIHVYRHKKLYPQGNLAHPVGGVPQRLPTVLSQNMLQARLRFSPQRLDPVKHFPAGEGQAPVPLTTIPARPAGHPTALLQRPERPGEGRAVHGKNFPQFALCHRPGPIECLQQRELGYFQARLPHDPVVELGHGAGRPPQAGAGARERGQSVTRGRHIYMYIQILKPRQCTAVHRIFRLFDYDSFPARLSRKIARLLPIEGSPHANAGAAQTLPQV
jgi:hypothetical protein